MNESHLTCHDLYSSHAIDDTVDTATPLKSIGEQTRSYEFASPNFDTTVSLIDPREEVFDDDPFSTMYRHDESGENDCAIEEGDELEYDIDKQEVVRNVLPVNNNSVFPQDYDNDSVNSNLGTGIVSFMNKNNISDIRGKDEQVNQSVMTQFSRLFQFGGGGQQRG